MAFDIKKYNDLTGLILGLFRERPGMYLGQAKISDLSKFIIGYRFGYDIAKDKDKASDNFFSEGGFIEWFNLKYKSPRSSSWMTPFLEEAGEDERIALEIFFRYLEEYQREKTCR